MSEAYEEVLAGARVSRQMPGPRHELICSRLHERVRATVSGLPATRLLGAREQVRLADTTLVCPDLALVTSATGKLWLAAEIVNPGDHRTDTVVKKQIYEDLKVPRLWMIDPRYDNVEVYHATEYGMMLKGILAGRDVLVEKLLPAFELTVRDLFEPARR